MPAAQPGGTEGIVGKQEIVDRMRLTTRGARLVRIGPRADARFVRPMARTPVGLGENSEGGRGGAGLQARWKMPADGIACKPAPATTPPHSDRFEAQAQSNLLG